jgi:type I restriction enzyme S subunit
MKKLKNIPSLRFPEFKEEWEKKKLGDIGDVKMCRRIFNDETLSEGDIPFFKIGSFGKVADAFITKHLFLEYREKFSYPKKGNVLISAAGTIGRLVIYNGEDAYYQDSNIVWIDNDETLVTDKYLYYILQLSKFKTEGGTIQRLYNSILKSTKFSCSTLKEQTKIASFLTAVDDKLQALKQKKTLLEQ